MRLHMGQYKVGPIPISPIPCVMIWTGRAFRIATKQNYKQTLQNKTTKTAACVRKNKCFANFFVFLATMLNKTPLF